MIDPAATGIPTAEATEIIIVAKSLISILLKETESKLVASVMASSIEKLDATCDRMQIKRPFWRPGHEKGENVADDRTP
jgi:hypothetical protein